MRDIVDDEQRSYRHKSCLPFGLRRRRATALSPLLHPVPHRGRRGFASRPGGARNAAQGTSETGHYDTNACVTRDAS
jgi:hypothetical protein